MTTRLEWGVLLEGSPEDLEDWEFALPAPFEPHITHSPHGAVLKSTTFDALNSTSLVQERATALLDNLYGAIALSQHVGKLRCGSVLEFMNDGTTRGHHILHAEGITLRIRMGRPTLTAYDKDGNVIPPPPPQPSEAQNLLQTARLDERLDKALHHLSRADNWFDIYMAGEALFKVKASNRLLPKTLRKRRDVDLLMKTANTYRHAYADRVPANPMAMDTAQELLRSLICQAAEEVRQRQT